MRRPRSVLAVALALLVAVLALFTIALLRANANDRREAERRFTDRASVSAALTEGLFASTAPQSAQQNKERFGGPVVSVRKLDAVAAQGRLTYLAVLDAQGVPIGFSTKTPPEALKRLAAKPDDVRAVMAGRPFFLTDFLDGIGPGGVMEYAVPFEAQDGTRRYTVSGFPSTLISLFLSGYLGRIPDARNAVAYVIDAKGRVIGSPVKDQPPGSTVKLAGLIDALKTGRTMGTFDSAGSERAFAAAGVDNSTWRVVLATRTEQLYAGISTRVEWLILAALALAGLAAVLMLSRTTRAAVQVQTANDRLAQANDELAHSNLELKRSNAELEQFASVASHDLQEPLRKVQTFGDQLERRFGDEIPDEAIDYLRRMRRAAGRMSTLIEDLLRFSRVTTHARPPVPVDLARVAREVTSDLDAPIQEAHGTVEISGLPTLEADPLQMRQLLQNLIGNGIKFHRPGVPPVVRLSRAPARQNGTVSFLVEDNGIGFEPEYEERIFRVFERLHPRDVYPGTGIGLALCRKIVERHGGTITAQGMPDEGARFTVTLPVTQAHGPGRDPDGQFAGNGMSSREPSHA
jgi:signal transduction histidine kinase